MRRIGADPTLIPGSAEAPTSHRGGIARDAIIRVTQHNYLDRDVFLSKTRHNYLSRDSI